MMGKTFFISFVTLLFMFTNSMAGVGGTITQLTNNLTNDQNPQINDSGQVVWEGDDESYTAIFYYDGTTVTQLIDGRFVRYDRQPAVLFYFTTKRKGRTPPFCGRNFRFRGHRRRKFLFVCLSISGRP